jgi:hypothetical protein
MQRVGWIRRRGPDQPGLVYVLNNLGDQWSGATSVHDQVGQSAVRAWFAWDGHDTAYGPTRAPPTPKEKLNSLLRRGALPCMYRSLNKLFSY